MTARKVDWEQLKLEYIQGGDGVTHKVLSTRHGLAEATVSRRASSGRWLEARSEYRQEVVSLTAQKTAEAEAERRAAATLKREKRLDALFDHVADRVESADPGFQVQAHAVALGIIVDKLHKELGKPDAVDLNVGGQKDNPVRLQLWDWIMNGNSGNGPPDKAD